ncbi:amidase family protein [Streptomyces mirabilis]|uniref:amidase family protein n=1 Tax=Streptomyces mirabilis TaxID=68239 RepID=UPI0035DB36A6
MNSLRLPAHYCGVCGFRPTRGLVPARGHISGCRASSPAATWLHPGPWPATPETTTCCSPR